MIGAPMEQTFVFADLAGFTALTEARGDDHAADVALAICAQLKRLLPEGAEDLKLLGDACLIRVPRAGDAVELGLRLVERPVDPAAHLDVRVGMHTGTAVQRGPEWFGSALNVAARVVAQAQGGEVLLTAATRAAAEGVAVRYVARGTHELRGLTQPLALHAARRVAAT